MISVAQMYLYIDVGRTHGVTASIKKCLHLVQYTSSFSSRDRVWNKNRDTVDNNIIE